MLLHSIMMRDAIFPPEQSESSCIYQNGRWFEGSRQNGQFCISRVISTNPADYLRYTPGQTLSLSEENHRI